MARRAIQDQTGETIEPIDAEFRDRSELQGDIDNEENEFAQAFGQDTDDVKFYFDMHRIREGTNKRPFLFKGTRADLADINAKLLRGYGSGDYEVRIWKEEGGKKFLHRKMPFSVEAPMTPVITQNGQIESPAISQALQNQQQILQTLLERMTTQQAPQQRPPMSVAEIAALITAGAGALATLKTVLTPPATNQINPFEMMTGVIDLVRGASDDGREKGVIDLVSDFVKSPMAEKLAEMVQVQTQTPRPALPAPQKAQIVTAPQNPPTHPMNAPGSDQSQLQQAPVTEKPIPQLAQLQGFLQHLVTKAIKASDPSLYADWILDQDEFAEYLPLLQQPGALEILIGIEPSIAPHRFWFNELLHALLTEDDTEQAIDTDTGTNAQASNVSGLRSAPVQTDQNA